MSGSNTAQDVTPIFHRAASMFGLDPLLPMAVAQVESGGHPDPDRAVSSAGALGRMQIMPPNLQRMNVQNSSDPEQNIYAGTSMLDEALTASKGDVGTALRIYQGGPDRSKWGAQNAAYPAKVAAAYQRLSAQQAKAPPDQAPAGNVAQPGAALSAVQTPTGQEPQAALPNTAQAIRQTAPDGVDDFLSGRSDGAQSQAIQTPPESPVAAAPQQATDHIDDFLSGSAQPATAQPPSGPLPFADGLGGTLPDGSATRDPVVWQRWLQQYTPSSQANATNIPNPDAHPGIIASAASGLRQGVNDVATTIARPMNYIAAKVNDNVPALAAVDARFGFTPATQNAAYDAQRQAYEASPEGQSTAGGVGRFVGNILAAAPALGGTGALLRGAGGVLAGALPDAALLASNAARANILTRGLVATGGNALTGAGYSLLTGEDPLTGAVANAVGAPVVKFLAPPVGRAMGRGFTALVGDTAERVPSAGAIGSPAAPPSPLSQAFRENPLAPGVSAQGLEEVAAASSAPSTPIPGAPTPVNPILRPASAGHAFEPQLNPAGEAAPSIGPNAPVTTAEMAAVPTALPRQVTPLLTQADYEKRADEIIRHFAQGGRTNAAAPAIEGSPKTLAQVTGNAGLATLERGIRGVAPNDFAMIDDGAKQAQQGLLGRITGSSGDYENAVASREAATGKLRNAAFAQTQTVSTQPILDHVDALIAKNAGRPTVQEPLQRFRAQVAAVGTGEKGAQVASPQDLYNARQYLSDMVAPRAAGTANDGRAAATQLLSVKPVIDSSIESGAPGFRTYLKDFENRSGPINGMEYLQSRNLTDIAGNPQLGAIDKTLKDIGNKQTFGRGAQAADSISPNQVEALKALRDDLLQSRNSARGKALGSDTTMNLATNSTVNTLTNPLARGAARIGGAFAGGIGGYAASEGAAGIVTAAQQRAEEGVRTALIERLLDRGGKGVAALNAAKEAATNNPLATGIRPMAPRGGAFGSPSP